MNERMRELMEQCQSRYEEHTINLAKFAELIVHECALQCNHNDDMDRILNHFRVEE